MKRLITYCALLMLLTNAGCKTELEVTNNSVGSAVGLEQHQYVGGYGKVVLIRLYARTE